MQLSVGRRRLLMAAAVSPAVLPPPQPREQKRVPKDFKNKKDRYWKVRVKSEKWECSRLSSLKNRKRLQRTSKTNKVKNWKVKVLPPPLTRKLKSESAIWLEKFCIDIMYPVPLSPISMTTEIFARVMLIIQRTSSLTFSWYFVGFGSQIKKADVSINHGSA